MKRFAIIVVASLLASAGIWTLSGGIHASAQQSPSVIEIHRAHTSDFVPAPDKPIFFLILGSDQGAPKYGRLGAAERGHSDSIHIVGINPTQHTAYMIGIPRDSYVPIPGHGSHKINAAMVFGGPQLLIDTIRTNWGITIDYWMLTSFEGFIGMAAEYDRGLTIYVPFNMHDKDSSTDFDKGTRHLDAGRLLGYARNRHSAPNGDFTRSFDQGIILATAQADARQRVTKSPLEVLRFLKIMRAHIQTDIPFAEQLKLGLLALSIKPANVHNMVTPGTTGATGDGSSVFISAKGNAILRDIADDGIVENP